MPRIARMTIIIILFGLMLGGCFSQAMRLDHPVVSPSSPVGSPHPISSTPTSQRTNPMMEEPQKANNEPVSASTALSASIEISAHWGVGIDDQFVYWVDESNITAVQRRPLTGTTLAALTQGAEIIAQGTFPTGIVSDPVLSSNSRWLVFLDRSTSYAGGDWKVQAVDLLDRSMKVIFASSGAPYETAPVDSLGFIWFGLGENEIALSYALHPAADDCQRIVLRVINLVDGQQRVLKETDCAKSNEIWIWPQMAHGKVVVERSLPVVAGGGTDILLYDLPTAQQSLLTNDGNNAAPYLSADYIVWKRAYRSDTGRSAGVYNFKTGKVRTLDFPTPFPRLMINQHWLYWFPDSYQSIYLYDLSQDGFVLVADSEDCKWYFEAVAMRNEQVAWIRRDIAHYNATFLEWRSIKGLPTSEYQICE